MSNGKQTVVKKRRATGKDSTGIYESSTDALKQINEAFDYWSGQITATSLQMCYALIGANCDLRFGGKHPSQPIRDRVSALGTPGAYVQHGIRVCAHLVHEEQVRLCCFRPQTLGG
jgi:hypothetical protein